MLLIFYVPDDGRKGKQRSDFFTFFNIDRG